MIFTQFFDLFTVDGMYLTVDSQAAGHALASVDYAMTTLAFANPVQWEGGAAEQAFAQRLRLLEDLRELRGTLHLLRVLLEEREELFLLTELGLAS